MPLFRKWGFGATLTFDGRSAIAGMAQASSSTRRLRTNFKRLRDGASQVRSGLLQLGGALIPALAGAGLLATRAASLASDFEANEVVFETLLGSAEKAKQLITEVKDIASGSSFSQSDLLEGSKRLLRLTGDNINKNTELLNTVRQLTALNPSKSVTDAVEAVLDATSGGGFERLKEFGFALKADDFKQSGRAGGKAWAAAVVNTIDSETKRLTRGKDLDGLTAQTSRGIRSIFGDAVTNLLTPIGAELNRVINPAIQMATKLITDLTQRFNALSPETKKILAQALLFVGGLTTGVAVIGGLAVAIGALGTILSGAASMAAGLVGVLSNPVVLASVAVLGSALATVGSALAGFIAIAGPQLFPLINSLGAFAVRLLDVFRIARDASAGFLKGLMLGLSPLAEDVLPVMQSSIHLFLMGVQSVVDEMGGLGIKSTFVEGIFVRIGKFVGDTLVPQIRMGANLIARMFQFAGLVAGVIKDMVKDVRRLVVGIIGVADGSLKIREGIALITTEARKSLLRLASIMVSSQIRAVELLLRSLGQQLALVPGLGSTAQSLANSAADGLGDRRRSIEGEINGRIDAIEKSSAAIEKKRLAVTVTAPDRPLQATVNLESKVCIDENEIARANGSSTIRSGERGQGPNLPPEQRLRIVRGGGQVVALNPEDAF